MLNHTTAAADLERVLAWLESAEIAPAAAVDAVIDSVRDRHPVAAAVRLERDHVDAAALRAMPFFAALDDGQLDRVAGAARVIALNPGDAIVRRWESARDFYVIAHGRADVRDDKERVGELGAGDFFGELAALDWGASYGYPRLASVVATSPLTAVVLSSDVLNALMRDVPGVAQRVRTAVRERLPRC